MSLTIDRKAEKRLLADFERQRVGQELDHAAEKGARAAAAINSRSPIGMRIGRGGVLVLTHRTSGKRWVRQVYQLMRKAGMKAAVAELEHYGV